MARWTASSRVNWSNWADDFVIIRRTKHNTDTAMQKVVQVMELLKLTLHPTKTRVVDMGQDGFDFPGSDIHKKKSRKIGKLLPYIWASPKSMINIRRKIHFIDEKELRAN